MRKFGQFRIGIITSGRFKNLKPNPRLNMVSKSNLNPKLKSNLQRIAKPSLQAGINAV